MLKKKCEKRSPMKIKKNHKVASMNKDLSLIAATVNTVRQIIEKKDTSAKETNEAETEQITIEEMGQRMSENPGSITPKLQITEVEIMRQNVLWELGIIQNIGIKH